MEKGGGGENVGVGGKHMGRGGSMWGGGEQCGVES